MGLLEKIKDIELEVSRTQKNKATEHHLGILKAKLARYRAQLMEGPKGAGGGKGEGFDVEKSGDARVAMIGFPSVGKSTLLNKLTATESATAAYEFTTLTCIPGVIQYKGAQIQLLDLPGIIEGAAEGKGRGRQVIAVGRSSDLILMVLDASKGEVQKRLLTKELESVGIRLNKRPPSIYFKIKKTGGISFTTTCGGLTHLDERVCYGILHEYKIFNAEIIVREDSTVDDFIDVVEGNRSYIKCLYVYNKIDTITIEDVDVVARTEHSVVISANWNLNLDYLLDRIWEYLAMVRIYTKRRGTPPDFLDCLILTQQRYGCTIEAICNMIHRDMVKEFKYALVWGTSVKHRPQRVGISHALEDEDVVQIVKTHK